MCTVDGIAVHGNVNGEVYYLSKNTLKAKKKKMTQASYRAYEDIHMLHRKLSRKLKVSKSQVIREGISLLAGIHKL